MEETEHENLFHLIKIKKIYVEQLLDKLGYVKEETGMSKEMTAKEAFRRIDISLSDYLGEGLINERKMISQALTELEELKKRDTPMKLTQASRFTIDKKLYGMYACNSCHEVIPYITLTSKE